MRKLIRSPLTWLVAAELLVVAFLVVFAWSMVANASRPVVVSFDRAARRLGGRQLGPAGFPGCGSGAAWSDSRPQPEQHVLARAPRRAEPRTSGPRAAPVASCPWRDGRDEALRRDGGAARCSARRTRRGFAGSGLALFRRHRDVAVQRGAIFDREAAHLDVPVEPAGPAQGQAPLGGDVPVDLPADLDVRPLDGGLDRGAGIDGHVAARLEVALDVARDLEVALDLEAALQDVARAEADDVIAAVRRAGPLSRGFFCLSHGFLRCFFHTVIPNSGESGFRGASIVTAVPVDVDKG